MVAGVDVVGAGVDVVNAGIVVVGTNNIGMNASALFWTSIRIKGLNGR